MEIMKEYQVRIEENESILDIHRLSREIIPFFLSHNAEADACDLAIEVEMLPSLIDFVDERNYSRITLYLSSCVNYEPLPDDQAILKIVHQIYSKMGDLPKALITSIKLNDPGLIKDDFSSCSDPLMKRQLALMLARQRIALPLQDGKNTEEISTILCNANLSKWYAYLAAEFGVTEPKTPEDIYKRHLENIKYPTLISGMDSSKQTLSTAIVNGFVNAGFGSDKLVMTSDTQSSLLMTCKDSGNHTSK